MSKLSIDSAWGLLLLKHDLHTHVMSVMLRVCGAACLNTELSTVRLTWQADARLRGLLLIHI